MKQIKPIVLIFLYLEIISIYLYTKLFIMFKIWHVKITDSLYDSNSKCVI